MSDGLRRGIEGFSSGVMVAASIWSLLIPSMELSEGRGNNAAIPASVGFLLGIIFFLICDRSIAKKSLHADGTLRDCVIPCFAVAVHNLPEGMAVGAIFAELLHGPSAMEISAAMAVSIGIAVQNLPEGAIVAMPLYSSGMKKPKAFAYGVLSGAVEPLGAFLTVLAAGIFVPLLPYLLGFAAGAMMYAVLEGFGDTDGDKGRSVWVLAFSAGFVMMMSLDVLLG